MSIDEIKPHDVQMFSYIICDFAMVTNLQFNSSRCSQITIDKYWNAIAKDEQLDKPFADFQKYSLWKLIRNIKPDEPDTIKTSQ